MNFINESALAHGTPNVNRFVESIISSQNIVVICGGLLYLKLTVP